MLRILEFFATKFSHEIIADNAALVDLARVEYGVDPTLIAYGGNHTLVPPSEISIDIRNYYLSIARIEPENNCHLILSACAIVGVPLIFIGNWDVSSYGRGLKEKYSKSNFIRILDPIYDLGKLAAIRRFSTAYIHGHSVGGTNPSLVEAIFHTDRVFSFDCTFNRSTLSDAGSYFRNDDDLVTLLKIDQSGFIEKNMLAVLRERYQWKNIVEAYVRIMSSAEISTR